MFYVRRILNVYLYVCANNHILVTVSDYFIFYAVFPELYCIIIYVILLLLGCNLPWSKLVITHKTSNIQGE